MTKALLAAWKQNPHPRIAKAMALPAPFEGSLSAWRAAARKEDDPGSLIASLFTGKRLRTLPRTWHVAFLPDGRLIGALGESSVHLAEL